MTKKNTYLLAGFFSVVLAGIAFAAIETNRHDDGHGDSHSMGEMESHEMSAVGMPAKAGVKANKTIKVDMMDTMKLNFSSSDVKEGDIVKFIVVNKGKMLHEFGIGSIGEQTKHRSMMKSMPKTTHKDGNTISVEPGKSKELIWQFMGDETVQFACNIPGHFEAGMHNEVEIL